jgi:hypothetical protein
MQEIKLKDSYNYLGHSGKVVNSAKNPGMLVIYVFYPGGKSEEYGWIGSLSEDELMEGLAIENGVPIDKFDEFFRKQEGMRISIYRPIANEFAYCVVQNGKLEVVCSNVAAKRKEENYEERQIHDRP